MDCARNPKIQGRGPIQPLRRRCHNSCPQPVKYPQISASTAKLMPLCTTILPSSSKTHEDRTHDKDAPLDSIHDPRRQHSDHKNAVGTWTAPRGIHRQPPRGCRTSQWIGAHATSRSLIFHSYAGPAASRQSPPASHSPSGGDSRFRHRFACDPNRKIWRARFVEWNNPSNPAPIDPENRQ